MTAENSLADSNNNNVRGGERQGTKRADSLLASDVEAIKLSVNGEGESAPKRLWDPTQSQISQETKFKEFQALIEAKFSVKFENYEAFHKWSADNFLNFWEEFWHFSQIIHSKPYDRVIDKPDSTIDDIPFKWFDGARLNYAENLLRFNDDKIAIYSYGEAFKTIKSITFKKLRQRVQLYQAALKKFGIGKNDIVVGYMPNSIECLEAKLAVNSLGAIWSCASPDFGSHSVIDRFKQISPKLMFSVTSVGYNGKKHDHRTKLIEVLNGVESIRNVVLVPFYDDALDEFDQVPRSMTLDTFLASSDSTSGELVFEQVPFNHPLVILYSSGTTGAPKCIVHSHGGTLIQHLKEHLLFSNMSRDDIIFYYTTTGWMMYNWLISSLATGATIVLYDGSPVLPTLNVLWDLVDALDITMFGTSAKWLAVIEEKGCVPKRSHKLTALKFIFSTGSPLKPNSFEYVYASVKSDVVLGSITGGTDIISLFCGHNVHLPVHCGEIQCRHLGMAIECWNEDGKPVYDECGDLVCTRPFPSMPVYFHNDDAFEKYKSSYFQKYPSVWAHGDFCVVNSRTGGVTMLGRSDGTLNPNGVRFGSADIYNSIEHMAEIGDSLCVGQRNPHNPSEERVVLFVKVADGVTTFSPELVSKIKAQIRSDLSPRHVPNIVLPVPEIPYTLNGKKVEVPVRRIIEGHVVTPSSSLVNPKCLDLYRGIEALSKW